VALRTTVVGSWWPLQEFEQDLRRYHNGELGAEEAEALLNRCATQGIREQTDLGLTEWTSGEYFCDEFILHLVNRLAGIEIVDPGEDHPFDYDDMASARVVGEISAPNGLGYAEAYEREKNLPGGVPKATVVSVLEVCANEIFAGDADKVMEQMGSLTAVVNGEMREMAAAGCPHIQLDAPLFGIWVNEGRMTPDEAASLLAPYFDGLEGVTRGIHFCNGNLRGRPVSSVLRCAPWVEILKRLDGVVDVAALECSYFAEYLEHDAFKELPASMQLAAGIVDEANYWIEPVKKIKERAADWARVVGEERLWISPSCGFGRHHARDVPVLRAKMENMMEAASSF
jgi:5-methyltetrahydropteroyltriglutamate--homocysteine methyltransferase